MKKLFTLLLTLAALLSSTQAWAQGLKICGISVNVNATAGNQIITGAGISGKVEYNPQSRVLMLTNATLTSSGVNDGIYCYGMTDFQIYFSGTVNITTNSDGDNVAAIYCSNNIKLNGWSSEAAPVVNLNNTGNGPAIKVRGGTLSVTGVNITATASNYHAIYGATYNGISANCEVNYSRIQANGASGYYGLTGFTRGMTMNGSVHDSSNSFDTSSGTIVNSSGTKLQNVTIKPSVILGKMYVPNWNVDITTTKTGATSASGTAKFSSNVLTLTNVNVDGAELITHGDMTINFVGGGTISSSGYTMDLYGNTTLNSDGKVIIKSTGHTSVYLNYDNTNLEICMPEFQATCTTDKDGVYGSSNCKLILKKYNDNSVYKFLGGRSNVSVPQIVLDAMDIWSSHTWIKEGKVYYNDAIASSSNGPSSGTWFASKNQFTYYPLYVAGTQVNNRNYADIRNQYITSGTVSYNNDTKTLTLNGVTMDVTADDVNAIKTTSGAGDITIKAVGNNTLTSVADAAKLYSNTTFTSSSTADLRFISKNNSGISMYGSANATVNMVGFFQGKGAEYGFFGDGNTYPSEMLTLKKASSDELGYNFTGDQGGIYNLGSLKLDNMDFWYSTHGCYFDEADHRVEVNGGAVAKGPVVFGSIKEALPVSVCGKNLNRVNGVEKIIYVGSKYISSGAESVGYDPSSKTLTLNNAKIDKGDLSENGIYSNLDGLVINVIGTSEVKSTGGGMSSLNLQKNTTIQGTGTLNLTGELGDLFAAGSGTTVTINDVNINADHDIYGSSSTSPMLAINLTTDSKKVTAKYVYKWSSLTLGENTSIVEPFKAYIDGGTIKSANGGTAQNVVITKVEKYDLAVCDVDVNSYNKDDILRDGGAFKYTPNTKRLTIKDANIDDPNVSEGVYNYGIEGLNIAIEGENHFRVKDDVFKMKNSTIFSGNGSVKGELTAEDGFGIYLYDSGSTYTSTLNGPKFEFTGVRAVGGSANNLVIEKGVLAFNPNSSSDATILSVKGLTLGTGMIIAKPEGGTFDSSKKGIVVNGKLYNGHAVISQKGDVNLDGSVTIADAVAVLNAMAGQEVAGNPDVNGDKEVSIADFVAVLNIMAGQ